MPYVQRDGGGQITGVFNARQDFASEFVQEDDTHVATFRAAQAARFNPPPRITFLEFLALFTPAEQLAIASSSDANLKIWLLKATGTGQIDLTDPITKQGLDYLISISLLTSGRETAILAGTPPA